MESPASWTFVLDFVGTGFVGLNFLLPTHVSKSFNDKAIAGLEWLGRQHQLQLTLSILIGLSITSLVSIWVTVGGMGCDWDDPFPPWPSFAVMMGGAGVAAAVAAAVAWIMPKLVSELAKLFGETLKPEYAYWLALALVFIIMIASGIGGSGTSVFGWVTFLFDAGFSVCLFAVVLVGVLLRGTIWNFKQDHPLARVGLVLILFAKAWQLGWIQWVVLNPRWTACPEAFVLLQPVLTS
jgi:hypothetical protein